MRPVARGSRPAPSALSSRKHGKTELERARNHINEVLPPGGKRKPFPFRVYKAEAVKSRLEELFYGKCAYCESFYGSQAPVDVEHYRPKSGVEGEPDHPGYWWLAMEWTNLLPSCLDCNRRRKQFTPQITTDLQILYESMQTGKKHSFPIIGVRVTTEATDLSNEQALLLNPTSDDPEQHLTFWLGNDRGVGLVCPKSVRGETNGYAVVSGTEANPEVVGAEAASAGVSIRGAVSIQVLGLNRIRLVQERARLVQRLRFLETLVVDIGQVVDRLDEFNAEPRHEDVAKAVERLRRLQALVLGEMRGLAAPEAPYSAVAKAYLRDFKARITDQV